MAESKIIQKKIKVAFIKDVKANTIDGGTFTAGAWQTRTLNTLEDTDSIVTSLSSNQFTLPAGTYFIEARAQAFVVNEHKAVLYNVTENRNQAIGTSEFSDFDASVETNVSIIMTLFSITRPTVFEIRHRCGNSKATNGFGVSSDFGADNIYTFVRIERLDD